MSRLMFCHSLARLFLSIGSLPCISLLRASLRKQSAVCLGLWLISPLQNSCSDAAMCDHSANIRCRFSRTTPSDSQYAPRQYAMRLEQHVLHSMCKYEAHFANLLMG